MNVTKALKRKKKLLKQINESWNRFNRYNSHYEGEITPYKAKDEFVNWLSLNNELIDLKTKIHLANAPVYDKIFRMSELKSMITSLKRSNTTEGINSVYSRGEGEYVDKKMVAEVRLLEVDNLIKACEDEIEKIQEELEYHNSITNI